MTSLILTGADGAFCGNEMKGGRFGGG